MEHALAKYPRQATGERHLTQMLTQDALIDAANQSLSHTKLAELQKLAYRQAVTHSIFDNNGKATRDHFPIASLDDDQLDVVEQGLLCFPKMLPKGANRKLKKDLNNLLQQFLQYSQDHPESLLFWGHKEQESTPGNPIFSAHLGKSKRIIGFPNMFMRNLFLDAMSPNFETFAKVGNNVVQVNMKDQQLFFPDAVAYNLLQCMGLSPAMYRLLWVQVNKRHSILPFHSWQ